MADIQAVYTASALIHTGHGQLAGVVITTTSITGATATFYNNTAGSGTKLLELIVTNLAPVVIFFSDRFSPRFAIGLYLTLAANMSATVWAAGS